MYGISAHVHRDKLWQLLVFSENSGEENQKRYINDILTTDLPCTN
jgi:hypothetical protein